MYFYYPIMYKITVCYDFSKYYYTWIKLSKTQLVGDEIFFDQRFYALS